VVTSTQAGHAGPLISVVLPVAGVEEYLSACLDSLLSGAAPAGGIEVVAVDDASGDRCGAILDARARADPRLRVIHAAERTGPGPARMRGLAEAAGAYVWFVDPDDLVADGALAAIAGKLTGCLPDVLLLGYLILNPCGTNEPPPGAGLPAHTSGALTLASRPDLINATMTAWSKVIRRSFLLRLGVAFPAGIHEDVEVSCAVLLGASRIALLRRPCYLYRRRAGSLLAAASMDHFSIFPSYERVFALIAAASRAPAGPPVTSGVEAAVFSRAIEHYSSILANGLVPSPARREFFRRMTRDFRRYRPPAYRRPRGWRGLKIALIARGWYRPYAVLRPLNAARVAARRAHARESRGGYATAAVNGDCR
jgi:CDP-glycerol glycerophosphotransferase